MHKRTILFILIVVLLALSTAQAQYADKPVKQAPAKEKLCTGCTITGRVHSVSKDWIKIEQKRYYDTWIVFFCRITSKTEIIGTIRKGKIVTVTYTKEGIGGRYNRPLALTIKAD